MRHDAVHYCAKTLQIRCYCILGYMPQLELPLHVPQLCTPCCTLSCPVHEHQRSVPRLRIEKYHLDDCVQQAITLTAHTQELSLSSGTASWTRCLSSNFPIHVPPYCTLLSQDFADPMLLHSGPGAPARTSSSCAKTPSTMLYTFLPVHDYQASVPCLQR